MSHQPQPGQQPDGSPRYAQQPPAQSYAGYGQFDAPQPGYGPSAAPEEERGAAIVAHLSAPIAFVVSAGWLSFVGPLLVWLIYKDKSPLTRRAAAGAFNFNVAFWIVNLIAWVCIFTVIGAVIGIPLLIISFLVAAWTHIRGALRARDGLPYDYPFQLPILR